MAERIVHPDTLHRWMTDLWVRAGSSEREARLTADHLVGANLAGHDSHGVGMAPRYVKSFKAGELQLNETVRIETDNGPLITVDGRRGMGQSVTHQAMELAIERARAHGVCVMGLKNSHHLGRVGHWAEQAIAAGLASVHFTNAVSTIPMVAPHGGADARFLTNPFTVGIPRPGGEPIVLDFATSAIAHGKVRVAYNKKKSEPSTQVPEGSLIDAKGRPTRDPNVLFEPPEGPHGALQTAAAHKGYALAMVCELLGAALTGGATAAPAHRTMKFAIWNSMLAIVFDPNRIGPAERFATEARAFTDWVQASPLSGATERVMMPGDPERLARAARAQGVPIDLGTLDELDEAARTIDAGLPALSSLAR
ncbi:MAG TPA: malate/lactate/ureidoglycolate dehydrogenase [Burkholderiaceae bacterium]|nr:malate/lactate/ureidoglycolate dehydrogenase [Burkholderiaceae bacterium]